MAEHGLSEQDYAAVADWRATDRFSDREKAAIEYAELFVSDHLAMDDSFWRRFREHWSDSEVIDLTVLVGSFLANGRALRVLEPEHTCDLRI